MNQDSGLAWFGAIVAIISIICALLKAIQAYLPSKKMLDLDATLQETEELLRSAVEEGLLTDESFLRDTHTQLSVLRDSTLIIRGKVHSASTSTLNEYVAVFGGLTSKVSMIYRDVKELRATISRSSAEAKLKLQEGRIGATPSDLEALPSETGGKAHVAEALANPPFSVIAEDLNGGHRPLTSLSNSISSVSSSEESNATLVDSSAQALSGKECGRYYYVKKIVSPFYRIPHASSSTP
ncbi:uncharacterized protein STEHIDRAFT_122838 [Stereum hirsutum FP-91666 SS1]|uniref:uncharacterized protein n=1 Tax=Stereum hirsutum (strain FP-91666) TaxID=721885 RepID=UPI0004449B9C|nr:uncharacterized protein STEHIDRAFT_122838 [Stereum hirsutum FP-91666 SS1]EIM84894.1 hypothetical protein STEHIDRAFT_122838 [Stereum hirsutum FP-91666 SS1]